MAMDTGRQGEALQALGDDLAKRGFKVRLVEPVGAEQFLRVANPAAGGLSENVICKPGDDGELSYFYSWGDPIAPVSEMESAAERLVYLLSPLEVA